MAGRLLRRASSRTTASGATCSCRRSRPPGSASTRPAGAYYVMTDIRDLTDEDDVAFARRLIADPGVAAVPGSSFFSRPELGRTKLRFAFPKRLETLRAAAERLATLAPARRLTGPHPARAAGGQARSETSAARPTIAVMIATATLPSVPSR